MATYDVGDTLVVGSIESPPALHPEPATTLHAANLRTTVAATRLSRCSAFWRSPNCRSNRRYAANVSVNGSHHAGMPPTRCRAVTRIIDAVAKG
jgi:hypothetical protein